MAFYDTTFDADLPEANPNRAACVMERQELPMKLVSSSPEPKHTHRIKSDRSWFWSRVRSRVTPRLITSVAWLLLVIVVAAFAFSIFHLFAKMVETMGGPQ